MESQRWEQSNSPTEMTREAKESGRATMGRGWNTSFLEAETGDYGEFKGQPGLNIKTVPLVMMILMMMKAKSAPPSTRHTTPRDVKPDGQ